MIYAALLAVAFAGPSKKADYWVEGKGEPTYECPQGFDLQGKKCVRVNAEKLIPVCEDGVLHGDQCLLSVTPAEVCPDGFTFNGLVCTDHEEISPLTSCPNGYAMVTDKKKSVYCEKKIQVPGPEVCPQGTIDSGKQCVQYSYISPSWTCPPGTVQDGHFCSSFEYYDCSDPILGGKKKHLRMLKPKKHDVVVELGKGSQTEIVEVSRECKRTNYTPAVAVCPPGSLQDGKQCKTIQTYDRHPTNPILTYETADVESSCPASFQWCPDSKKAFGGKKEDMCCQFFEKPVYWDCPSGYQLVGGDCIAYQQPAYVCPTKGYKKSKKGDGCSLYEYREPIMTYKMTYNCIGKDCHDKKHH